MRSLEKHWKFRASYQKVRINLLFVMWNGDITGRIVVLKIHFHIFIVKLQMLFNYFYLNASLIL